MLNSKKCYELNSFELVFHQGIIEFAFAPEGDSVMKEWIESKKYDLNSFAFPETDTLSRVRSKIIHKKDQLSSETPNILVIRNEDFWMTASNYISIQDGLQETIHKMSSNLGRRFNRERNGEFRKTGIKHRL